MKRIVTLFAALTLAACSGPDGSGTGGGSAAGGGHASGGGSGSTGGGSGSTGGGSASTGGGSGATGGGSGATGGGSSATGGGSGATGGGSGATGGGSGSTGGGSGALGCAGMALPTTAPAMITISGRIVGAAGGTPSPLSGATVTATKVGGSSLGMATSGADGTFTINVTTGGTPVDFFLKSSLSMKVDSYWWPSVPASANQMTGDINMFDSSTLGLLGLVAGISVDSAKTQIFMDLRDCNDMAISGATVSASPMPQVTRYIANNVPSSSATATDSSGAAFLGNETAGMVTVGGMSGTTALRSHQITAVANSVLMVGVQP